MSKFETFIQLICWISFSVHFAVIAHDFFVIEVATTTTNTETLTLRQFPFITKLCIDPAFDEENFGYDNPQEFIARDLIQNFSNTANGEGCLSFQS